jgi:hypothetical protein
MENILNLINNNSNAISALSSLAMLIATVTYVIINSKMHKEMKLARTRDEAPDLALKLQRIISGFYDLKITNYTSNPLYNLKFLKFPESALTGLRNEDSFELLKSGISYMAPSQEYSTFFINFPAVVQKYGKAKLPCLEFEYSFNDINNNYYKKKIVIELSSIYNTKMIGSGSEIHVHLHKIIELMEKLLKKMSIEK